MDKNTSARLASVRQLQLPNVPKDAPLPVIRSRDDAERICGPGWWDACGLDCLLQGVPQ